MVHALNDIYAFNTWLFYGERKHLNAFMSLGPILKTWREKNYAVLKNVFVSPRHCQSAESWEYKN